MTQQASDEEEPLSSVRGADARSAGIECPAGVSLSFQVRANNVEPLEAVLARNLFAKHNVRATLADEGEEGGPEMSLVLEALLVSGVGEGLAGTRPGPDGPIVGPSSESKSEGPSSDSGEGVE